MKRFMIELCSGLSSIAPAASTQHPQIAQATKQNQPVIEGTWSDEFAVYARSKYPLRPIALLDLPSTSK
ncbi:hypothetical protein [Herpetosiphon geysericola]|uniref:hypothetical protein n=1 Tax=Herpetosiphon geysericola TaxID=70996 RepID=UPI00128ECD3A|nr:hypothetical protein [Herpetosiphon geysericola]